MNKPPDNPYDAYASSVSIDYNKSSDALLESFIGKHLEIYIGDQVETLNFEDYSVPQNCIIYGKLVQVLDRFLVLDCFYVDKKTSQIASDNRVFLNKFQIRAMTELSESGSLNDIFLNAKSSEKVRKILLAHK
jgi:hypothetical protein